MRRIGAIALCALLFFGLTASARVGDHADSFPAVKTTYVSFYKPGQISAKGCLELKSKMQEMPLMPETILGTLLMMSMVGDCMKWWEQESGNLLQ